MSFSRRELLKRLGITSAITAALPVKDMLAIQHELASDPSTLQGKPLLAIAPNYLFFKSYDRYHMGTVYRISTMYGEEEYGVQYRVDDAEMTQANFDINAYSEERLVKEMNKYLEEIGAPNLTTRINKVVML